MTKIRKLIIKIAELAELTRIWESQIPLTNLNTGSTLKELGEIE